jgi:DNA modification methylase
LGVFFCARARVVGLCPKGDTPVAKSGQKEPKKDQASALIRSRIIGHGDVNPADLLANPLNFRRHPGNQMDALRGSMKELGWLKTILVNKTTGHVLDGHARVEEAMRQCLPTIPATIVELDPEEERLALAVLDPITEMATRDADMLADLLAQVSTEDPGLQALLDEMGKKEEAPTSGLVDGADPDAVPEAPKVPITKPGDIITLGRHRLMCGDSTKAEDVARLMNGAKADMVFTDPPYNVAVAGGNHDPRDKKNFGKGPKIMNDSMPDAQFKQFLVDAFTAMGAVIKDGAAVYVAHADTEGVNFRTAFVEAGFMLKQCLIWSKQNFVFGRSDYHWQHEPILYGWRAGAAHAFYGERNQGTIWSIDRPMRSEKEHPTQKPIALVEKAIRNSSKSGDLMFEPFGGSGSTMIAAEKTGRTSFLMELDPIYCDVIVRRWEEATGRKAERHKEIER